jgi:hypothetical protein
VAGQLLGHGLRGARSDQVPHGRAPEVMR